MKQIIKFYAEWCGPCRMYAPIWDKVTEKYKDQVEVISVDVDNDTTGLAAQYKIQNIPYTIMKRPDQTMLTKSGQLSEQELEELILS